ncbi:MAG TPA: hypothetical protein VIA18_12165, partial [Polyangia bacterium]|nr:hypothetical protein [Polyangia bacterium]
VFPAPITLQRERKLQIGGPLIETFLCCLEPLIAVLPAPPGAVNGDAFLEQRAQWTLWCCRMKEALIGYFSSGAQSNCELVAKLQCWSCPDSRAENFAALMQLAYEQLTALLLDAMLACLCAALLPPAPFGTSDDRVPLAIIKVRKRDCTVLEVCNWTSLRKQVITWPAVEYWLSWIPWLASFGDIIGTLCCREVKLERQPVRDTGTVAAPKLTVDAAKVTTDSKAATNQAGSDTANEASILEVNPTLDSERATDNQTLTALISAAFARAKAPVDPAAVVGGVFGFDAGATQPMSAAEQANVAPFLLLNQVLRPIVSSLAPATLAGRAPLEVVDSVAAGGDPASAAALYRRVSALEDVVKQLQQQKPTS